VRLGVTLIGEILEGGVGRTEGWNWKGWKVGRGGRVEGKVECVEKLWEGGAWIGRNLVCYQGSSAVLLPPAWYCTKYMLCSVVIVERTPD